MEWPEARIKSTLLSQEPREGSFLTAVLSGLVLLFISLFCWQEVELYRSLAATPETVFGAQEYWRLITMMFVHADIRHLLSNGIFVIFFGYLLYGYYGFWIYPASMLLLGTLTSLIALMTYPANIRLLGASGLVYLMVSFWLTMYIFVERTASFKKRLLRAIGISLIVLLPTTVQLTVSYRTHAIGCALGIIAGILYFQIGKAHIRSLEFVEIEDDL